MPNLIAKHRTVYDAKNSVQTMVSDAWEEGYAVGYSRGYAACKKATTDR